MGVVGDFNGAIALADLIQLNAAIADGDIELIPVAIFANFYGPNAGDAGLWGALGRTDPGITAMVASALLTLPEPRPASIQAGIDRALEHLLQLQREDGSIHEGTLANYITSASVLAMVESG
ncbi:MAG: hypothetical protein AAGF75_14285, partial [Cyanobacteria bacterium P01_H01_bin.130]